MDPPLPERKIAPPSPFSATLSTKVSFVKLSVVPSANTAPPPLALLPEKVDALTTRLELWKYNAPPLGAVFPTNALGSMVVVCDAPSGVRKMAPPRAPMPAALEANVEPHTLTA